MREGKPRPKAEGEPHTSKAMTARSEGMHGLREAKACMQCAARNAAEHNNNNGLPTIGDGKFQCSRGS